MMLFAFSENVDVEQWRTHLISNYPLYELTITDIQSLENCLKKNTIDLLLLDKSLLGEGGLHELSDIQQLQPEMKIIVFSEEIKRREEVAAILFGAKAYCQHDIDFTLLQKIIDTILKGEVWVDRQFVSRLLSEIEDITKAQHHAAQDLDKGLASLTPREYEISQWIARGASNRKIAEQLNISERTVKAHLGVIFRKIKIEDRLQLALYINRHGQIGDIWHRES